MSTPLATPTASAVQLSVLSRLTRAALLRQLSRLERGSLRLRDATECFSFGEDPRSTALKAELDVLSPAFYGALARGGALGAGESYIRGEWRSSDLSALMRLMIANRSVMTGLEHGLARLTAPVRGLLHWLNKNSERGSRRNIAAHYDLGNEFFELFLDPTMAYSCGIFAREDSTLEQASVAKFDSVCRKLDLQPGQHVLEIGTGWGGLAVHAARHYGCRVTTTTISERQYAFARQRIAAAGLSDRVTLLKQDYRQLRGEFDALFSIEMIEAVGHQYLETYFAACSRLLKPTGMMLLQAITIRDQLYAQALRSVDFIKRFIFPGSFIPSVHALVDSVAASTDMKLFDLEDIGPHYARTLRTWRENLAARAAEARSQGCTDQFLRMWEYYFCYCEGGFAERQLGDAQMLLTKPDCRRAPLARPGFVP